MQNITVQMKERITKGKKKKQTSLLPGSFTTAAATIFGSSIFTGCGSTLKTTAQEYITLTYSTPYNTTMPIHISFVFPREVRIKTQLLIQLLLLHLLHIAVEPVVAFPRGHIPPNQDPPLHHRENFAPPSFRAAAPGGEEAGVGGNYSDSWIKKQSIPLLPLW